ncbi:hypothetical protein WDW37_17190 [Bdellovibrionota bacterium FG-1]
MTTADFNFRPSELRKLRSLSTPPKIQRFLDSIPYHVGETAWSPRRVLCERTAHCLEGAIFAAGALRVNGYPPLLVDLEAVRDSDHVIAVFQNEGCWGAIAASNFSGLRYREPVYRSLRELTMSFFDDYFNLLGERTLRRFSRPVNLQRFDRLHWMTTDEEVWFIPEHLVDIPHVGLLTKASEKQLVRVSATRLAAGKVGAVGH